MTETAIPSAADGGIHQSKCSAYCRISPLAEAFSLIEVLIVLVILCLLAGLIYPVVLRSRGDARRVACLSNLRQLHIAFAAYAQDHDGCLPPYQNSLGAGWGDGKGNHYKVPEQGRELVQALHPYTKSDDIWFCPKDILARSSSMQGFINHRFASYKTNAHLGHEKITGETTDTEGPSLILQTWPGTNVSNLMLMTDCLWSYDPSPDAAPRLYSHNGSYNELFFDGHVKRFLGQISCRADSAATETKYRHTGEDDLCHV